MILIDSSVWIALLRREQTTATLKFKALASNQPLLVGDVVLLEVLQGAQSDADAARIERTFRQYRFTSLLDVNLSRIAARNYRTLRGLGITLRKTADLIIGTYCIENGHRLLHQDRDFDPMEKHLGLKVV